VICPGCGLEIVSAGTVEWARRATQQLAARLKGSPYFRGVGGLAYTLRGQVRGFLDDPAHPLARIILRYLFLLATEGGTAGLRHLLQLALTVWLLPGTPLLVPAVAYLRKRYAGPLRQASLGDDAVELRRLRAQVRRGEASPEQLGTFVDDAFDRWYQVLSK